MKNLDHIVYAVSNLEQAMDDIEKRFGIRPTYGGKHENEGTHNALLHLGDDCYFEILAVDPDNDQIKQSRWMGIDLIEKPTLTRWAVRATDMDRPMDILKKIMPSLTHTTTGMRKREDDSILKWKLSLPLSGPLVEIVPFFIDWQDSEHPSKKLPSACKLVSLKAIHPDPALITSVLQKLALDIEVEKGPEIALVATINTPNGVQTIT